MHAVRTYKDLLCTRVWTLLSLNSIQWYCSSPIFLRNPSISRKGQDAGTVWSPIFGYVPQTVFFFYSWVLQGYGLRFHQHRFKIDIPQYPLTHIDRYLLCLLYLVSIPTHTRSPFLPKFEESLQVFWPFSLVVSFHIRSDCASCQPTEYLPFWTARSLFCSRNQVSSSD